jgi:NarL family two-component system response regulator LiaR
MTGPIRIIVVDDHSKVHLGITAVIDASEGLELVAHGSNGHEALILCQDYNPDVVLMDVVMPDMNGIEATRLIRKQFPHIKVLALSSFQDDEAVREMLNAGAAGYLLKTSSIEDLAHTIRAVHAGKMIFSPEVTLALLHPAKSVPRQDFGLTPREREILKLLVEGRNNTEIAATLSISLSTVKFHASSIFGKLGVTNRVEAVALAVENRVVD